MLSCFPTEIIEEILLILPLRELIATIKVNKRLWSISRASKTPLRYRLQKRPSILRLTLNKLSSNIDRNNGDLHQISIWVFIDGEKRNSNGELFEHVIAIRNEKWEDILKRYDNPQNYLLPHKCYTVDKMRKDLEDQPILIKCPSLNEGLDLARIHLVYLIEYFTIVKEFHFHISRSTELLDQFLDFLGPYNELLGKIYLALTKVDLNSEDFYESRLFDKGIYSIDLHDFREKNFEPEQKWHEATSSLASFRQAYISSENNSNNPLMLHERMLSVRMFRKRNTRGHMRDEQLLQFTHLEQLDLDNERHITAQGIAKLVEKVYNEKHLGELYYKINVYMPSGSVSTPVIESILAAIPPFAICKDHREVSMTNKFGERFRITLNYDRQPNCTIYFQLYSIASDEPQP